MCISYRGWQHTDFFCPQTQLNLRYQHSNCGKFRHVSGLLCCVADQSHGVDVGSRVHKVHKLADKTVTAADHEADVTFV